MACLPRVAMLSALLLCLTLLSLLLPASSQPYSPLPFQQTASSCGSGTSLFTVGSTDVTQYYAAPTPQLQAGVVYLQPFNNSNLGGTISQLSLALLDNSALTQPAHLRLGLYALSSSDGFLSAALLAQTPEVTLFPSGPQTLYASLQSAYTVLLESTLLLGVWSDATVSSPMTMTQAGFSYSGAPYYGYVSYTLPNTLVPPAASTAPALAASGCYSPSFLSSSSSRVYGFCSYTQQYVAPPTPPSTSNYASTVLTVISGTVVVDSSSPAGSGGFSISAFRGVVTQSTAGLTSGFFDSSSTSSAFTLQSGGLPGVSPSNALYPTGQSVVDGSGVALALSGGGQLVLQWNATSGTYQTLSSASSFALSGPVAAYSGASLVPITASSAMGQAPTCVPPTVYQPDAAVVCPAGTVAVQLGDVSNSFVLDGNDLQDDTYGNTVYFRSFTLGVNTTLYQLQYFMYGQPGLIVHMRIGVFAAGGSSMAPSYTLLSQTAQITLANPATVLVQANLPSPLSLGVGSYALGVWFDTTIYGAFMSWGAGVFGASLAYTSVSSSGAFPSTVNSQLYGSLVGSGAVGCVPTSGGTTQLSFCAAFSYATQEIDYLGIGYEKQFNAWNSTYSAVLTVLSQKFSNSQGSYYVVLAANGTASLGLDDYTAVPLSLTSFTSPSYQYLYDPSTSSNGLAVDSTGLQFQYAGAYSCKEYGDYEISCGLAIFPGVSVISAGSQAFSSQAVLQEATAVFIEGTFDTAVSLSSSISYSAYTPGSSPTCQPPAPPSNVNSVTPYLAAVPVCAVAGTLSLSLGDATLADFTSGGATSSIPASTIYTNSFTGVAGGSLSTLGVVVGSNTKASLSLQLGVYDSSNALVGQSGVIVLDQVGPQRVLAALQSPISMTASKYTLAVVSNGPLYIPTSSTQSPIMASAFNAASLPATFASSGSASAVPLVAFGCAQTSFSFCAYLQFASLGSSTTTYLYEGILATGAGGSNSQGSYVGVALLGAHLSVLSRQYYLASSYTTAYYELSLAPGTTANLYTSGSARLDSTGLQLSSASGYSTTLSYSAATGLTDTAAVASYGAPLQASFNVSAVPAGSNVIPSCSLMSLPAFTIPPAPAAPVCPSGQSLLNLGNEYGVGLVDNTEADDRENPDYIALSSFTTGSGAVVLSQVGVGIFVNWNVVARATLALYDANYNLLSTTNEVVLVNSNDQQVVGSLLTPQTLQPSSLYWVGLWTDSSLFMPFGAPFNTPCMYVGDYITNGTWPASFTGTAVSQCGGATLAVYGLGCSASAPAATTSSSGGAVAGPVTSISSSSGGGGGAVAPPNTGGGGSNDVSLTAGAVVGIVIGCVVGTNLLLLLCLWLFFGMAAGKASNKRTDQESVRSEPSSIETSRVEMQPAGTAQY